MQRDNPNEVVVSQPSPERRGEVAALLFHPRRDRVSVCQTETAVRELELQPGLLEARRGDRTVGAAWGRSWADGTAEVAPPRVSPTEPEETAHLLLAELEERLSANQVHVAFAYLPSDDSKSSNWLAREGYRHAGELLVLTCANEHDSRASMGQPLSFHDYHPSHKQHLTELVRRTYKDTLDFPTLGGFRHIGDVLERYAETGESGTDHWSFVRSADRDIGCLLLADHQQEGQCELVYMGLVPEARGNGWGRQIVAYALQAARRIGRRQMVLGVDEHNDPAITVYASAGFIQQSRRSVLVKAFPCPRL